VRASPLVQLTLVKLRDLVREPEAIFWVLVFPILLSLALGIAFRAKSPEPLAVAVQAGPGADEAVLALGNDPGLRAKVLAPDEARESLRTGKVALVVIPGEHVTYWFDPARDESRVARLAADGALQRAAGRADPRPTATREMTEKGSRYIDFLVPGLLGMNLMGTGMWGIGFSIVTARTRKLLKRLVAAPMRRRDYLLSQLGGRLVFLAAEVGALVGFGRLAFGVPMEGRWLVLALVCLVGAFAFGGLGLLVASRARTVEAVSGLLNVVMLPMWLLSGVFFASTNFPDAMQPAIRLLPLTALNDALRAVMLEGASLPAIASPLLLLSGWGVAAFALALRIFRWR